ncbi:translation elongation factor G [candidate division WWE3 bacterium RIFCSPLOWO2_01_FULL_42_11]|uniref:Elongation factor G n=1 Tax=candidate division WWE3 bacterium RIFCSPLOWO2_01_FULL_42_11 TaxID=1802627 RepID=A0A1F4VRT0_UNCKA|nr:MAG: translation elongation factor G [candidate division WWE3 bacterium RIFCSPLOWO2_01_FULL_42_11]
MAETKEKTVKHEYPLEKIRNIGIIAHIDAGKTTITERILFYTGRSYKIGEVHEGEATMDWMDQERERGITITSAATTCFWTPRKWLGNEDPDSEHRINIIDTPGHVDFTAEVERSLRVLDGAVVILDGKMGVEPQSETVWNQANKYNVPRLIFANKLNLLGGDFYMCLNSVKERLSPKVAPIYLPLGIEHEYHGTIDIVERKAYEYQDPEGLDWKEVEIPDEMVSEVEKYREELIEMVADSDEVTMEKYLNGEELSVEEIKTAIRKATLSGTFYPFFGGDGRRAIVKILLDNVVLYLPSPLEVQPAIGHNPDNMEDVSLAPNESEPLSALAFKVQTDPFVGRLTYIRIYSGKITSGSYIYNSTKDEKERVGRLLLMHANHREDMQIAKAGEIVAAVGLKNTFTGDTLCDEANPVVLEAIKFAEPVISMAIEPKTKEDQEKMGTALARLSEEDPTFRIHSHQETGETLIYGMGELHLEILTERMRREFGVDTIIGAPQVAFRETIRKPVEAEGKYVHQSGGRGQYGHCVIKVEPLGRSEGFRWVDAIRGGSIPREFIPAVKAGVEEALTRGIIAGYELIDIQVTLLDGSFHDVDSSEIAFKIAGTEALQKAVRAADPVLLEPIMIVDVICADEFMGEVIGDLSAKRGRIESTKMRGNVRELKALVPLSEMFGYATTLRSMTQGRASFSMEPSHYDEVPAGVAEKLISKR